MLSLSVKINGLSITAPVRTARRHFLHHSVSMHFYFEDLSLSSLTQNAHTKYQQQLTRDLIYVCSLAMKRVKHHLSKGAKRKKNHPKVVFIPLGGLVSTTIDCWSYLQPLSSSPKIIIVFRYRTKSLSKPA